MEMLLVFLPLNWQVAPINNVGVAYFFYFNINLIVLAVVG